MSLIETWTVSRAILLLHPLTTGTLPEIGILPASGPWSESIPERKLPRRKSAYKWIRPKEYGGGWLQFEIDPSLAQAARHGFVVAGRGGGPHRFRSRETIQFAPYLLIEGRR